MTVYKY